MSMELTSTFFHINKDENVHRFAPRGELLERERENMLGNLRYSVRDP